MASAKASDQNLTKFISRLAGGREVGLVVAKDGQGLQSSARALAAAGLKRLSSVSVFRNIGHGWYLEANSPADFKIIYDFVSQYPLSIISLFDSANSTMVAHRPDFQFPFVLILTEANLSNFTGYGFDLLGRVGPVYRAK